MATNKRKDAAALFELIDKSSLKVPKNAGSLKIPSWWSSKTNPQPPASTPPLASPKNGASSLFSPSTNGSGPSPSIRAPGPGGAPKPVQVAAIPTPASAPSTPSADAHRFAPATLGSARERSSASPFSGIPLWAIVAGSAFVVLIICLVAFSLMHKKPAAPTQHASAGTPAMGASNGQISQPISPQPRAEGDQPLLPSMQDGQNPVAAINGNNDADSETPHTGQVSEPGTTHRDYNLYYIIIAASPTESIARRNAKFLADNGINVALEISLDKKGKIWYMVISAKGYPSMVAAEPDRKKIVAIGHLTSDYTQHHRAWDDAYVKQLSPPTTPAAPAKP